MPRTPSTTFDHLRTLMNTYEHLQTPANTSSLIPFRVLHFTESALYCAFFIHSFHQLKKER